MVLEIKFLSFYFASEGSFVAMVLLRKDADGVSIWDFVASVIEPYFVINLQIL